MEHRPHSIALVPAGNAAEEFAAAQEGWDGQSDCGLWNILNAREAAIENLLLTALRIEPHYFGREWIIQVCGRIVESQMPVRSNAQQYDINGSKSKLCGVFAAGGFGIGPG
jgi:hypothetical protein